MVSMGQVICQECGTSVDTNAINCTNCKSAMKSNEILKAPNRKSLKIGIVLAGVTALGLIFGLLQYNNLIPMAMFKKEVSESNNGASTLNAARSITTSSSLLSDVEILKDGKLAGSDAANSLTSKNKEAQKYYDEGVTLSSEKKWVEAITMYDKSINLNPEAGEVYFYKGKAFYSLSRYDEAVDAYRKALSKSYESDMCYYDLGIALLELYKLDEAEQAINKAMSLNTRNSYAISTSANLMLMQVQRRIKFSE